MQAVTVLKRGLSNGLSIGWELIKVVIPVYFAVALLQYVGVLEWLSPYLAPVMQYLGLPGEAALPILLGYTLNIYAAIGALLPLGLTAKQITVIAGMLLLAHALPMELAVAKKSGSPMTALCIIRLLLSVLFGWAINCFW